MAVLEVVVILRVRFPQSVRYFTIQESQFLSTSDTIVFVQNDLVLEEIFPVHSTHGNVIDVSRSAY